MQPPHGDRHRIKKSYPERIADLVNMYITNRCGDSMLPLLQALGCRHMTIGVNGVIVDTPVQPNVEYEPLIRNTLLLTLRSYVDSGMLHIDDAFALINGLYTKKRWRECLKNIDDAYCLAALCASLTAADLDPLYQSGGRTEVPCVCLLLNDWLRPSTLYAEPPSIADISRALFGDAWFTFAVEQAGLARWQTRVLMNRARPPFLPGLLPSQPQPEGLELPSLGDT